MIEEHTSNGPRHLPEYASNPFIAPLPVEPEPRELKRVLNRPPIHEDNDKTFRPGQRLHCVLRLCNYSQPTAPAIQFGLNLDYLIKRGYVGRNPETTDFMRGLDRAVSIEEQMAGGASFFSHQLPAAHDTALSFSALGIPGSGKTHTVKQICWRYPQVITHDQAMLIHQVVWLRVECPSTGSPKSLCHLFFQQLDDALRKRGINANYYQKYATRTLDVMLAGMARCATIHALGVLIIDEIQNVRRIDQSVQSPLLNFLVMLRNLVGIPVVTVGTMAALDILRRTLHDARRGDGIGSIYFERFQPEPATGTYGRDFERFVESMWRWQWTSEYTTLTPEILSELYNRTQGVIDFIVKLFILCQHRLIILGSNQKRSVREIITPELIRSVARDNFNIIDPFLKMLKSNKATDHLRYDDLVDFHKTFEKYITDIKSGPIECTTDSAVTSDLPETSPTGGMSAIEILLAEFDIDPDSRETILDKVANSLGKKRDLPTILKAIDVAIKEQRKPIAKMAPHRRQPKLAPTKDEGGEQKPVINGSVYEMLKDNGDVGFGETSQ